MYLIVDDARVERRRRRRLRLHRRAKGRRGATKRGERLEADSYLRMAGRRPRTDGERLHRWRADMGRRRGLRLPLRLWLLPRPPRYNGHSSGTVVAVVVGQFAAAVGAGVVVVVVAVVVAAVGVAAVGVAAVEVAEEPPRQPDDGARRERENLRRWPFRI